MAGTKMRVLLVEDSERMLELVTEGLTRAGYLVDGVGTAAELLHAARTISYGLLIVDLMLPDGDGLEAIRNLRAEQCSVPILIITAKESVEDRVMGLDAGADDFLTKPFHEGELLARVRALLRRPSGMLQPVLRVGYTELDEANALVRCSGETVDLRLSELRLLALLIRQCGTIVTKRTIEEGLSAIGRELSVNALEASVSRLRKSLDGFDTGIIIETVRSVGYRLKEGRERKRDHC